MKNKPEITSELAALPEKASNQNEHSAITARYSADRFDAPNSGGAPAALLTSCGLDKLWGITSHQS